MERGREAEGGSMEDAELELFSGCIEYPSRTCLAQPTRAARVALAHTFQNP